FTPEFLIYVLGAIDQYRRCSYENMLNHRPEETFSFSLATYAANIEKELKSGDLRWLLPAFAALTPGFNELNLTEDKMVYEQLIDADVMLPVSSGEAGFLFGFGEVGKDLGTEFFRTWVQSAGIEVNNITTEGMNLQHRAFVAGTMLANHFFEILPAAETRNRIRYAPLNRNALGELLEAWATPLPEKIVPVETIKQEEKAPALVTEVTTAETITGVTAAETVAKATTIETITDATAAAETSNCTTCGSVVLPGAHFCPKCGTILAPKKTVVPVQKFCSQCGQPVNEKNRFCSKCGKPIS
ncbi:MAG: zinc ribbon domain-containing protein, partial [Chitinophagaceae bacterium]